MNRGRAAAAVGAGAVALLLSAACSDNAGESVVPEQATARAGGAIVIEARDFSFVPDRAESETGSITIELRNAGAEPHSLTVYESDDYSEPLQGAVIEAVEQGESQTVSFEYDGEPTTLNFRCEVHPDRMNGEISVGGSSSAGGTTTPQAGASPTQED